MRILVGKVFGIGNAVMAVPMIKALQWKPSKFPEETVVDILIGNTPDDIGAFQVLSKVVKPPGKIYVGSALEGDYDVAIMAIPFDGRWQNGVHFRAKEVMDGRTRPDPSTTGLVSWKDHESRYQMQNARQLGFLGIDPPCSFLEPRGFRQQIYLGMGYKKDAAGFWKTKHWGNENYAKLVKSILDLLPPPWKVVTTGDMGDMQATIGPIMRSGLGSRFELLSTPSLDEAFKVVSESMIYIGNDTGMMHVAASAGRNIISMFFLENSIVKSRPLAVNEEQDIAVLDGTEDRNLVTVDLVMTGLEVMLSG